MFGVIYNSQLFSCKCLNLPYKRYLYVLLIKIAAMKLHLPLFLFFLMGISSTQLAGQAKKYTLFEHFTQASCGPCAVQNPAFKAVYDHNDANSHHISYHTSWPGTDPMHNANSAEPNAMVTLYGVSAVPDMIQDGASIGGPANVSQSTIDKVQSSPIRMLVSQQDINEASRSVTVTIETVGEVPTGNHIMRVLLVEKEVNYNSAPGSNGERFFLNVFRRFIANSNTGVEVELANTGESVTFEYEYDLDSNWDPTQIYAIAYVQNTDDNTVLNSGASTDPVYNMVNTEEHQFKNGKSASTKFSGNIYTTNIVDAVFLIEGEAPDGWTTSLTVNGASINDGDALSLPPGDIPIQFDVNPGTSSGVGSYAVIIVNSEMNERQRLAYFVINNVKDLVVIADAASNVDIATPYVTALSATSTEERGTMGNTFFPEANAGNALEDVENIYYSIGWTFPALTDQIATDLMSFMDRGGNLLIAGQDVGWDIMSLHSASNGTPLQRTLYTDYLQTRYIDDGSSSNRQFYPTADDAVFGDITATTVNTIYTSANTYPDQINPNGDDAVGIFNYSTSKSAGVRVNTGNYKAVYLGIGLEQVADPAVAQDIFTRTHDWFHGLLSNTNFVSDTEAGLGNAYPNPTANKITIDLDSNLKGELKINITDLMGKIVFNQSVLNSNSEISMDLSNLAAGTYYYQITNGKEISKAKKLVKQ